MSTPYDMRDEKGYEYFPPSSNRLYTEKREEFALEPHTKNTENISKVTFESQLKDLCPVWKSNGQFSKN